MLFVACLSCLRWAVLFETLESLSDMGWSSLMQMLINLAQDQIGLRQGIAPAGPAEHV